MGNQEAAGGAPRVGAVATLLPHLGHIGPVHHGEGEAKAAGHLLLPLAKHRGRAADHHPADPLAQQHLPQDQTRLDRLAQAYVVSDKQAHPGHVESLAQRFQLVGLHIDPGPIRGLEQFGIGGGGAVPTQGVEVGRKLSGLIKATLGHRLPAALPQHLEVDLPLPEHREPRPDGVVLHAGQHHHRVGAGFLGRLHLLHQVAPRAAAHHRAGLELDPLA